MGLPVLRALFLCTCGAISPEDELPADGTKLLERVVERKISAAVPFKRLATSAGLP
jgi:hypothetical protein